jgi:hypothetical protein
MNTQHDRVIDNNYEYLVGVLNQLRRINLYTGATAQWTPQSIQTLLHTIQLYRQFTTDEIIWLAINL